MSNPSTREVAEHMLSTGKDYTAAILAEDLGVSTHFASGKIYNIRVSRKYQTEQTRCPGRTVKVISIGSRKVSELNLWDLVIFGKGIEVAV